jgi:hypothetical protein
VLTDVLVDLEFVDRAVMDAAIDKAHSAGSAAERVLLTQGAIDRGPASGGRSPSASASITSPCATTRSTPTPPSS